MATMKKIKDNSKANISSDLLKELQDEASKVFEQFTKCDTYKKEKGILEDAKRSVDFYEGRQWEDTNKKKLPFEKPVINVIQNHIDGKEASILSKSWKINFSVNSENANSTTLNKFTEWQMKELKQENLNKELTHDGLLKGSLIAYFYWDEDAIGQMGVIDGGIKAMTIDIQDIAVANPRQTDIQLQEYIIIHSRESVKKIREMCSTLTNDEQKELYIKGNDYTSNYSKDVEQKNEEMTDVFLKFFKKNGEVFFQKSTKEILIQRPIPLNPFLNKQEIQEELQNLSKDDEVDDAIGEISDSTNNGVMDEVNSKRSEIEQKKAKLKASVYPIAMDSFVKRDKCIMGVSYAAQLIAPQKNINQLIATTLLTASKSAMPTTVIKEGALGTQSLDFSKPGRVIVDYSPIGTDGIKQLNLGTLPTSHYDLAQSMISMVKDVYRGNDILNDGRNTANGLSGYAMSLITTLQEKPVAQWQQALARMIEQEGRILEMFYKLYYSQKTFSAERTDAEMLTLTQQGEKNPTRTYNDIFNGTDYLDTPFNVTVEVAEGAKYNEASLISLLETLFLNGTISKLDPSDLMIWANLMPESAFPKKNEFKLLIEQKQKSLQAQLMQENESLRQQLQQVALREKYKEDEFNGIVAQYNQKLKQLQKQGKGLQEMAMINSQNNRNA